MPKQGKEWEPHFREVMKAIYGRSWEKLHSERTLDKMYEVYRKAVDHGFETGKRYSSAKPDLAIKPGPKGGIATK